MLVEKREGERETTKLDDVISNRQEATNPRYSKQKSQFV